jgi:hypothetical protein
MPSNPTPDVALISAVSAATAVAFRNLVLALEESGALDRGTISDRLRDAMEQMKDDSDPMTLALLHEIRLGLMD